MSTEFRHPIRKAKIHTFKRSDEGEGGAVWLARLHPYSVYPVFFSGATEDEVIAQAEALRAEAIAKHEASCIARQQAAAKARETRKAREDSR